jgi:hypothetical protein
MKPAGAATRTKKVPNKELVPLDSVRAQLALVWLTGTGIIFLLLVVQSLMGRYEDKTQEAWGWLLPTIMPSLGLIVTVLGYSALDPMFSQAVVRRTFVRVAVALSLTYLLLILLTIMIQPAVAPDATKALELMRTSNLWLGPFQGLVASALGVLFVTKKEPAPPASQ